MKLKLQNQVKFLIISLVTSIVFISIGFLSKDLGVIGNTIILSTFIIATPQLFLTYKNYRELREMEEKFPLFLRNLVESLRSGMSLHKVIIETSKIDYGRLSKEIKKMANQISWGMNVDKVLDQFSERVKRSKRLYTSIRIIRESYLSGGEVISTLESVADGNLLLEESEREKRSLLEQYVVMMYIISLVFLIIVVAINRLLIPIFKMPGSTSTGEIVGFTNPCENVDNLICALFSGTSKYIFAIPTKTAESYYAALFFWMALIQSISSGLVAGQISENSAVAGAKHSFVLVGITVGMFYILIRFGLMGA